VVQCASDKQCQKDRIKRG